MRKHRDDRIIRRSADFDGMQALLPYLLRDCGRGERGICAPLFEELQRAC